jgi:Fur family peroxide stress response transcriptional regulator
MIDEIIRKFGIADESMMMKSRIPAARIGVNDTHARNVVASLSSELRSRGYRLTKQRLIIAEAFLKKKGHFRVSSLYNIAIKKNPNISLSTIYNTMTILEKLGFTRRISGSRNEAIFDSNTEPHVNMVCPVCGRVEDVHVSPSLFSNVEAIVKEKGCTHPKVEITVHAICKAHSRMES